MVFIDREIEKHSPSGGRVLETGLCSAIQEIAKGRHVQGAVESVAVEHLFSLKHSFTSWIILSGEL